MKIAFVSKFDPLNRTSWSGIYSSMVRSLESHCGEITLIQPQTPSLERVLGSISRVSQRTAGKRYDWTRSVALALRQGAWLTHRLRNARFDAVFSPAGAAQLAFLKTPVPIVYSSDATFTLIKDLYDERSQFLSIFLWEADFLEQHAISRAAALLYPSEWAADSAVRDYGAPREKVHVFPYGANLEAIPRRSDLPARVTKGPCRLLFLGVDWKRKGGAIAWETRIELERLGVSAELTICGCIPPAGFEHKALRVIPFLDKNDPAQEAELKGLLQNSHFLLLPTRGECFGIVFCEASAYGLPSVATRTGGVEGAVRDGINGYLLPPGAGGRDYAALIAGIFGDSARYQALCASSRSHYEQNLNWDVWGKRVKRIMMELRR
jgi:glycosyltransferase involved in cell wall biosynthesis